MVNYRILLIVLLNALFLGCACEKESDVNADNEKKLAVRVPLGDPFIMLYEDTYYAYGTFSDNGIAVFISNDLKNWRVPAELPSGLALHKNDVWGERWFWAPEVYEVDGIFYMYFSADEHICVATSDNPLGPFTQKDKTPMIIDEKCIDNSLFFDREGKPWLYFVRFNDGNNIWVAELEENLLEIKPETMKPCIHVSQEWEEVWPRVNEGAFVVSHKNLYYMSYSANSYESQFYGVGFATSESPTGPWIKYDSNPILQKPGDLVGVGHSAMFYDKAGNLRIVFHAHKDNQSIHPRNMYIGSVEFKSRENDVDVMVVGDDYLTPVLDLK
ncbi:glycoside hydrolase family 43 protein [Marinilabilia salmonicolor]|jgi:beta-xylosidase|uniref:Glycosyl hydrolase family 43 n=1 Tax=Marinilabilia salmonicolor TaxID=989 RepID=A0A2T0XEG5_9BACT|nr:glycoside hydrolase family 43 protein [Marinilabilia salmonicolor]PRY97333.1 glycosyl hydrolase family 43 [Marinilabilia salmonicolor]RCW36846.1 glycosyl hydrolase family 43 [Marinilabilia salmonicolor]